MCYIIVVALVLITAHSLCLLSSIRRVVLCPIGVGVQLPAPLTEVTSSKMVTGSCTSTTTGHKQPLYTTILLDISHHWPCHVEILWEKYICIIYISWALREHRQLKSFLIEDKDQVILHGCWWPGITMSQGIYGHGFDLSFLEYAGFSTTMVMANPSSFQLFHNKTDPNWSSEYMGTSHWHSL